MTMPPPQHERCQEPCESYCPQNIDIKCCLIRRESNAKPQKTTFNDLKKKTKKERTTLLLK